MSVWCKWWGHSVPRHGYYLNQPYFRRGGIRVTDGVGRIHQSLVADCSRCGTAFEFGRIHDYKKESEHNDLHF